MRVCFVGREKGPLRPLLRGARSFVTCQNTLALKAAQGDLVRSSKTSLAASVRDVGFGVERTFTPNLKSLTETLQFTYCSQTATVLHGFTVLSFYSQKVVLVSCKINVSVSVVLW